MLGRKPDNGYHPSIVSFYVSSLCKNEASTLSIVSLYVSRSCKNEIDTLSTISLYVSRFCKNETKTLSIFHSLFEACVKMNQKP
jgi:hypothetical protein